MLKSYCLPQLGSIGECLSFCPLRAGFLSCHRQMRPPAHRLWFSGTPGTYPAPRPTRALFFSFTRSVSTILSLYAFILAFPVKVLSMIDRSDSLTTIRQFVPLPLFHAMQALHSLCSLQCVRELQCPQTRRRIFWVQPLALFQPQSLAMEVPLLLCQL